VIPEAKSYINKIRVLIGSSALKGAPIFVSHKQTKISQFYENVKSAYCGGGPDEWQQFCTSPGKISAGGLLHDGLQLY